VLSLSKRKVVSSSPARAGVTERSDSGRILTPGSFFYVEMWPPVNILRQVGSFFSCRKRNQTINSTVSRRKVIPVEYWRGSNFYVEYWPRVIILRGHFSTIYTEKSDPRRILTGGSHFYVEKMTPGSLFYGVIFLQLTRRKMTPRP
jgi:hypothetical protein